MFHSFRCISLLSLCFFVVQSMCAQTNAPAANANSDITLTTTAVSDENLSAAIGTAEPAPSQAGTIRDRAHLLAARAAQKQTHTCEDVSDFKSCHNSYAEGCTLTTKPNTYDAYLSFLKNTTPGPQLSEAHVTATLTSLQDFQNFDQQATAAGLAKQHQADLAGKLADIGQGNFYAVVGFLYYAMPGGIETCNCKLKSIEDRDYHLGIGFDSSLASKIEDGSLKKVQSDATGPKTEAEQTAIIVEMTPHYRAKFHPQWTLPRVQQLAGKQVKIVGQLLVDNEHNEPAQNCALPGHVKATCWRGSAFELHPVTQFYVCGQDTCRADSTDGWVELDKWEDQ